MFAQFLSADKNLMNLCGTARRILLSLTLLQKIILLSVEFKTVKQRLLD